jgi:hypothetical protein
VAASRPERASKFTIDELVNSRFPSRISDDIDLDPCKGGKSIQLCEEYYRILSIKNVVFWDIKTQFVLHRRHITSQIQSPAS